MKLSITHKNMKKSIYTSVKIKLLTSIATDFKKAFPELEKFKNSKVLSSLVRDEFMLLSGKNYFDTVYYKKEDIKEIFQLK